MTSPRFLFYYINSQITKEKLLQMQKYQTM